MLKVYQKSKISESVVVYTISGKEVKIKQSKNGVPSEARKAKEEEIAFFPFLVSKKYADYYIVDK